MKFQGREAVQIENEHLRVTVLVEGGHIAEVLHKQTGVNPLWVPPWPSIEPSVYRPDTHPEYGGNPESKLLAGIMGHNLCLDLFGPPSAEEAAAGVTDHGESSVARYEVTANPGELISRVTLQSALIRFTRRITLDRESVGIEETVESLASFDRPTAWTQHATLGPALLNPGETRFLVSAAKGRVFEEAGFDAAGLKRGADFEWPLVPKRDGGTFDLSRFDDPPQSGRFTTQLMDQARDVAYAAAWSPSHKLLFGYRWRTADFPWLGIWLEKQSRQTPPWNGRATALGLEFGVTPFPEPKRRAVDRGQLFGVPTYRWLPAKSKLHVKYEAMFKEANALPASL